MGLPKLIILYGGVGDKLNEKQQRMIDGGCTCGYREYARKYGHIIYLTPQKCHTDWEHTLPPKGVLHFLQSFPKAVIWSVKHDVAKDKEILSKINNPKVYYSCCNRNMINHCCNISLVDTLQRVSELKTNAVLHIKGKDQDYWLPRDVKTFDYLLIGRRADKNEIFFINELNNKIKKGRSILWIGGAEHVHKLNQTYNKVVCTDFIGQDKVRDLIPTAKIGILFTEHPAEGFPQSILEMTMCGLPTIYNLNAPINKHYISNHNTILTDKSNLISIAEAYLDKWTLDLSYKCREEAILGYSLEVSYRNILKHLELI